MNPKWFHYSCRRNLLEGKKSIEVMAIHKTTGKEDPFLLLFGNSHVSLLRQVLEGSPAYDFI